MVGLKPDAKGMVMAGSGHEVWRLTKDTPDVPSPLIHDGLVYLCRENGSLFCWTPRRAKSCTEEDAQRPVPRLAGFRRRQGLLHLPRRRDHRGQGRQDVRELAENKLPDQTSASPAISNGRIYIRGFETLWAIGAK